METTASPMADNIALLRRYYDEVLNRGNLDAVDGIFAPEYVSHHDDPAHLPPGPAGVRRSSR